MTRSYRLFLSVAAACLFPAGTAFAARPASAEDAIASLQSAYVQAVTPGEQADMYRELFGNLVQRIQRSYATEIDLASLRDAALQTLQPLEAARGDPARVFAKAMNAALGTLDPYSRYFDPQAARMLRSEAGGSFVGLGLQLEPGDGAVRIVAPVEGSPAARAGLQAGDLILRVDDLHLKGIPLGDAIARMRGEAGTPVALTIRRAGSAEELTVSLTRELIKRERLRWNLEGDVLVLRLASFTGPVTAELEQAIATATADRAPRAVVLDLRGNPGGALREAVTAADLFLAQGEIVSLRGAAGLQRSWKADAAEVLSGVPMVVLVDRRSASAAELVAAALQENGRAIVLGQRSFGKGTVQTTFALGEEAKGALKLTTAYYHGPSGKTVQKTGVAPDVEILESGQRQVRGDAQALPAARPQVEQARCAALYVSPDPVISCAIAFLQSGDANAFIARAEALLR